MNCNDCTLYPLLDKLLDAVLTHEIKRDNNLADPFDLDSELYDVAHVIDAKLDDLGLA